VNIVSKTVARHLRALLNTQADGNCVGGGDIGADGGDVMVPAVLMLMLTLKQVNRRGCIADPSACNERNNSALAMQRSWALHLRAACCVPKIFREGQLYRA